MRGAVSVEFPKLVYLQALIVFPFFFYLLIFSSAFPALMLDSESGVQESKL